jgi:hypothetical protein
MMTNMLGVVKERQGKEGKFNGDTINNPTKGKQKKRLADDSIGARKAKRPWVKNMLCIRCSCGPFLCSLVRLFCEK